MPLADIKKIIHVLCDLKLYALAIDLCSMYALTLEMGVMFRSTAERAGLPMSLNKEGREELRAHLFQVIADRVTERDEDEHTE